MHLVYFFFNVVFKKLMKNASFVPGHPTFHSYQLVCGQGGGRVLFNCKNVISSKMWWPGDKRASAPILKPSRIGKDITLGSCAYRIVQTDNELSILAFRLLKALKQARSISSNISGPEN